ncbi:glucose dehydrogenase [FAD, quinone]-like [Maniola jurtina]|uniref:glucose dehydrogenase [FAD, quinone]-like n=1 Tax=Maniola jurtina TaxID=191418 RepID=UPI001E687C02|nr:glucose dehydrogenase [FAD, quinone]-like [Maniola jurtina]
MINNPSYADDMVLLSPSGKGLRKWSRRRAQLLERWRAARGGLLAGGVSGEGRARGLLEILALVLTVLAAVWATQRATTLRDFGSEHFFGDSVTDGEEFDYIVVGAGPAGSAAAARLALAGSRVLLLEAGGEPGLMSKMPGATLGLTGTSLNWHYATRPNNKSCLCSDGRACRFARGRCVGGSTGINFMMYTRGNARDYDYDLPGWNWEHLEPYFLKYEGLYDSHRLPASSARHHNTSGVVPVGYFGDSSNPWHERIVKGLRSLGVPYNPDVNAHSQIGVSQVLGYTAGGERVNIGKVYLEQKRVKNKLKLVKNTRCTGVIIDENNVARGVTVFREPNETLHFFSKHEVVLSAGAIATPQLLMLSGVGPRKHLKEFGIPVKADLPVGEGMSDHILPVTYIQVDDEYKSSFQFSTLGEKSLQAVQWLATRSGPMASISLTDVTTFINTACYNFTQRRLLNDRPECELPTLQLIHAYMDKGLGSFARSIARHMFSQCDEVYERVFSLNEESSLVVVSPILLQPESRGRLRLASSDPLVPPAITPNYLDDERDVEEMVRALKFVEHIVETPIYKKYNASVVRGRFPGCPDFPEEGYWECYARHMTQSVHHAVGTAALGRVVDERLKVMGIRRLRVADASVLPYVPRGNTAAAIIAIGERLADFLIEDRELILH